MNKIKLNDICFSKNGTEFNCIITEIKNNKVTVRYSDKYDEYCTVDKKIFKYKSGSEWDIPNWTFSFEQLNKDLK